MYQQQKTVTIPVTNSDRNNGTEAIFTMLSLLMSASTTSFPVNKQLCIEIMMYTSVSYCTCIHSLQNMRQTKCWKIKADQDPICKESITWNLTGKFWGIRHNSQTIWRGLCTQATHQFLSQNQLPFHHIIIPTLRHQGKDMSFLEKILNDSNTIFCSCEAKCQNLPDFSNLWKLRRCTTMQSRQFNTWQRFQQTCKSAANLEWLNLYRKIIVIWWVQNETV